MQSCGKDFGKWHIVRKFVPSRHSAGYQEEAYDLLRAQASSSEISPAVDATVPQPEECGLETTTFSCVSGEQIHVQ